MSTNEQMLDELKEIRKLLTPPEPGAPPKGTMNEFKHFLSAYRVMGLAVAFILGIYLGALVQALVGDLVMPIVSLILPGTSWQDVALGPFMVGHFAGTLLTFIIVALVIFLLVKITKRFGID
jgi:large conductance mechanosensitive channel